MLRDEEELLEEGELLEDGVCVLDFFCSLLELDDEEELLNLFLDAEEPLDEAPLAIFFGAFGPFWGVGLSVSTITLSRGRS